MGNVYNGESLKDFNHDLSTIEYGYLSYLFAEIQKRGRNLFEAKNERYEASFFKQIEEDGSLDSTVVRLKDKVNRFSALIRNPDMDSLDESIKDTLIDLANYATMTLVFIELRERRVPQSLKEVSVDANE